MTPSSGCLLQRLIDIGAQLVPGDACMARDNRNMLGRHARPAKDRGMVAAHRARQLGHAAALFDDFPHIHAEVLDRPTLEVKRDVGKTVTSCWAFH